MRTHSFGGITVPERWQWTRARLAEEKSSIAALLRPMGDIPMKALPGEPVDPKTGRLLEKTRGP